MQENPVISDRVPIRGDLSEGSLGGRLAQRHAALREVMAAGARFISCLPSMYLAPPVPRPSGSAHGYLSFQSNRFLIVGVDTHRRSRILSGFSEVAALEEDTSQQNMRFDQRVIIF